MRERLTRTGQREQLSDPARIKIGCTGGLGWPPVAGSWELKMAVNSERGELSPGWPELGAANPDRERGEG